MYKRPTPRPKRVPDESLPVRHPEMTMKFCVPVPPVYKQPAPIWSPSVEYVPRVDSPNPFHPHIYDVVQKYCPHRPPLKALVDAMRLDGFSDARIKQTRDFYATLRRTVDKRQGELEKIFGKYSKPVKKVLKVLKKN